MQSVKIHLRVLSSKVGVTMGRHVIHIVDLDLEASHSLLPDRHYDIYIILTDQSWRQASSRVAVLRQLSTPVDDMTTGGGGRAFVFCGKERGHIPTGGLDRSICCVTKAIRH